MSSGTSILQSIIQAVNPKDKACYTNHSRWRTTTVLVGTSSGLKALTRNIFIGYLTGIPYNLNASITAEEKPVHYSDLLASLRAFYPREKNLAASISSFIGSHTDIKAKLFGWKREAFINLSSNVVVIEAKILIGMIRCWRDGEDQFRSVIRGWRQDSKYLKALIQPHVKAYLNATLNTIHPVDLLSYIKSWPYRNLQINISSWAVSDLSVFIAERGERYLAASIGGHYPIGLAAIIKSFHRNEHVNLLSNITTKHISGLTASLNYFYKRDTNLNAFLSCRPIHLLKVLIVGWAHRDLSATLTANIPPWYLPATIFAHGGYKNLKSNIFGSLGVKNIKNLCANLSGWDSINLLTSILPIDCISLMASITSVGGAKDLAASIKVREIVFNEFYKFSTANTADLRVYIGFSLCTLRTPKSAYASLLASLLSVPTYNLAAAIKGIKIKFSGSKDLGIFISYTNRYSMLSKFLSFKMSTSISKVIRINPAFFKDSLNITFKIINGQTDLKTLINGQLFNSSLKATIHSRLLVIHGVGSNKVLTEELVEIDEYRRKWSEFVDVYLEARSPIYYFNKHVFSENYIEPIISFVFKRASTKGIQHDYNLDHDLYFDSTDSAIRYGFSKISGRTSLTCLSARIQSIVKNLKLNVKIKIKEKIPVYLNSPFTYLKFGSLSFMGDNILYKSKLSMFGGIQDMTGNISATPN